MTKVVVLGGGIAGLSAAHELMERGVEVEVYEAMAIPGGKARSIPVIRPAGSGVSHSAQHGKPVPGEHGFRFFPRFYRHVVDTMSRIPYAKDSVVSDNLVDTTRVEMTRYGATPVVFPTRSPRSISDAQVLLGDACILMAETLNIPREEIAFFGACIWQIMTSCYERRLNEYEKIGWWEFIGADQRSEAYQRFMGYGITRSLVAAKARLASTKTIGDILVQLLFDIARPGTSSDRLLNGPTNDVWINPWVDYLRARGVKYHLNSKVAAIHSMGGKIHNVAIERDKRTQTVTADYFVSALPVEKIAPLITPTLSAIDPQLANLSTLADNGVDWMIGIQLYLTHDVPINHGHTLYLDSQWAITSVSQRQFWTDIDFSQYADGCIQGILSVDISEWDIPGIYGKTARQCSAQEIKVEVWEQLKRSLNVNGKTILKDEYLHEFYMPPDLYKLASGMMANEEPLLVNLIDTWKLRPEAVTRIPNLFLASDYVRTYTDLATMEGANEAARRAVNGILAATQSSAVPCEVWNLHEPNLLAPLRALDRIRYYRGLPWDGNLTQFALSAINLSNLALRTLEMGIATHAGGYLGQLAQPTTPLGDATNAASTPPDPFIADEITEEILVRLTRTAERITAPLAAAGDTASDLSVSAAVAANPSSSPPTSGGRVRIIPQ